MTPDTMVDSQQLVTAWYELAVEDKSPSLSDKAQVVFRFMALWVAFDAHLSNACGPACLFAESQYNSNHHRL